MLKNIFNPDNTVFRFCGRLADVLMLSLLWLLCCIPIITIGTATAALYNSTVKYFRGNETSPYILFRDNMKANFKDGIPVSILMIVLLFLFTFELTALWNGALNGSKTSFVFLIALVICSFVPLSFLSWLTSIFSRYVFTFPQLVITSFKFVFAHLFSSIILGLLIAASIYLCYLFVFPLTFLPCFITLLSSFFIEKAFLKH